ncbi:DUF3281 family protein [Francisella tularensis subsp. novicida]|uniref:DUF3281 family protein n=1 Tax=Francisella tularensis TaxID=263 RepID=UPI000158B0E9|nr:DUF3281 family protein [Francisella tularensis]AJI45534.1 hypothetical protein AS84_1418 [Francisella tularensis subsp. novicida F6168]AJI73807.1 hypothetical protein AQ14_1572 [Francisella tularensis subsp. novicida D9876]AJJ47729.1 hypothetical protein CH70_838 [Francisella tularensis subsp. novicida]APC98468.1 hypothetical protein KX03_1138 [Francisella tularensis subsp. novicida]EDN36439.1 conserved hypothetical protein [Francisella tularensis subsp. novicida GA99-3549]
MITKKKLLIGAVVISSTVLLASCDKPRTATELRIVDHCNTANDLCEFELTDAVVSRYTNILGKTIERVESQTPLHDSDIKGTITWNLPIGAAFADNSDVKTELGLNCQNDSCTANSNPTAYNLAVGSNTISVSGTVTVDGKQINLATDVKPDVIDTQAVENSYVFPTGTLPDGLTLKTLVDTLNVHSQVANGKFSASGSNLRITCNSGYEWLDAADPTYGAEVRLINNPRGTAIAEWDLSTKTMTAKSEDDNTYIENGFHTPDGLVVWYAGCWPVDSSK